MAHGVNVAGSETSRLPQTSWYRAWNDSLISRKWTQRIIACLPTRFPVIVTL